MSMIRNYTSQASVSSSVERIERTLVEAGAKSIAKDYDAGLIIGIRFELRGDSDRDFAVRLPARVHEVYKLFKAEKKLATKQQLEKLRQQAERTAWALLRDWVDLQMSMIKLKQVKPIEVFLPYFWTGTETLFEAMEKTNFKMLGEGFSARALPPASNDP